MNWKKIAITALLVLPLVISESVQAEEKNPCGKNPCEANAQMKSSSMPIRKKTATDKTKLMAMGEKLWNDTKLGTSGLACATCHPDGKGLKKSPFPKYIKMANDMLTFDQMVNFCMMNPMKAKPLPWNSVQMTALAAYAQSHTKEEGAPMNPCATKNPCGMKNPCGKK